MKKENQNGFTLIEVMIALLVVGILGSVATIQYKNNIARAQVAEGLSLLSGAKHKYHEFVVINSRIPSDDEAEDILDGVSETGSYVTGLSLENGKLSATFGNKASKLIAGEKVSLYPIIGQDEIGWRCSFTGLQDAVPSSCK